MSAKTDSKTLEELIVDAKRSGLSDKEIGEKFNVSFNFIEKAITKLTGVNISTLDRQKKSKSFAPKNFKLEEATVWSFKSRGNWATHTGDYRGNWSPYIPRNAILRYSKEGESVLDCFCGSGATAIECKLLDRNFIGIDINPYAIKLATENVSFDIPQSLFEELKEPIIDLRVGDARDLAFIKDNSIDLICAHPPYADIIQYTDNVKQDLSFLGIDNFLRDMAKVARENHRVLKDERYCAVLIGDMRKKKHVVPLGFRLIDVYLNNGFVLKELVIKRQHNCRTTGFWYKNSIKYNFLLLAHEYMAIFQKSNQTSHRQVIRTVRKEIDELPSRIERNKLETTTVWISRPTEWYKHAMANLISRYDGRSYTTITQYSQLASGNMKHDLIIWDVRSKTSVDWHEALQIVGNLEGNGYLAILCEDARCTDGSISPSAISAEKQLSSIPSLKVKEIIVISIENGQTTNETSNGLVINHKYLLVYQKLQD